MERSIENRLTELFQAHEELLGVDQASPLTRFRRAAMEQVTHLGIPKKGSGNGDRYHYTSLRETFDQPWHYLFTASEQETASSAVHSTEALPGEMYRTTFVNGFCADEQKLVQLPNGVVYGSLAAAVESFPELVARYYNTLTADTNDAVEALTAAFVQDGAFVYVPKGVRVELPIAVESRFGGADQAIATFGRNLFIFEEGSEARLVLDYRSVDQTVVLACRTREMFVGAGARIDMVEGCRLNSGSSLVSCSRVSQSKDSVLHAVSVALSGKLMRNEQRVRLEGQGAENRTNGLMIAGKDEHLDFTTDIEHLVSDCNSYQLFKGVAADGATSVFSGRIYVAQDAQRTQAFQQNNNLLLGDEAHAYAKPQLEIYADNVKCSHGATVGQLDPEAIYYMRQRGIDLEDARRLQMYGFVLDVLAESRVPQMNELFDREIGAKIEAL